MSKRQAGMHRVSRKGLKISVVKDEFALVPLGQKLMSDQFGHLGHRKGGLGLQNPKHLIASGKSSDYMSM